MMSRSAILRRCLEVARNSKPFPPASTSNAPFSTSSVLGKSRAGKYKVTKFQTFPLTYEMAMKPWEIGVHKGWLSWNTQDLFDFRQSTSVIVFEDVMIRKFMNGTWPQMFASEIIIKRRGNVIYVSGLLDRKARDLRKQMMYWLIGYSEEFLSLLLKQPVKLELQTIAQKSDIIYKYI